MRHDFNNKETLSDEIQQKETIKARPKSVLEAFEYIVEAAEDSKLSEEFFEKISIYVRYASRKLKLSPIQTVLLALFVVEARTIPFAYQKIASIHGMSWTTKNPATFILEIDTLEEKHYLRASRSHRNTLPIASHQMF